MVARGSGASVVLVHSPLVGAMTWRDVASLLRERGWNTIVPDLAGVIERGAPYHDSIARHVASSLPPAERLILVGHSFAGALLPAIAAASAAPVGRGLRRCALTVA